MRLTMKIRNDSGIPEALEKVKNGGCSANSYAVCALKEKLIHDGYLSADSEARKKSGLSPKENP